MPSFTSDLMAQLFSDRARFGAERYSAYNGFLGLVLLGGAFALRTSGPPDRLGAPGFALVVASALALLAAYAVPALRPRLVPVLLAAHGLLIVALTVAFALACALWALATPAGGFRYLPGLIVVGMTYGAALWADFGPARARPRPWRLAGFVAGAALEVVVAVLVVRALARV